MPGLTLNTSLLIPSARGEVEKEEWVYGLLYRKIVFPHCYFGKDPVTGELTGHEHQPTTVLINEHKVKWSSKSISLYLQTSAFLGSYQLSFFVQWIVLNQKITAGYGA